MARIGFPYTLEMHEYMKKEMDKGFGNHVIWKAWPDIWKEGDTPSETSIRRRMQRIELLGIEGALRIGGESKPYQKWTEEEEKDIILGYRECNGATLEAARLIIGDREFIKYFNLPSRNINDILSRIHKLQQEGQLEITFPLNGGKDWTNVWTERWEAQGFTIIDPPDVIRQHTKIKVRCSSGHIHEAITRYIITNNKGENPTFCVKCGQYEFKHPDPLAPGIFYYGPLLDSPLNDLKLGNTLERIGVKERSKKYGKFEWKEIHKPIGEVEDFEREMKNKYDKYCTHNPMLKGNGSTECFDLIILPKLEKDIKEWLK